MFTEFRLNIVMIAVQPWIAHSGHLVVWNVTPETTAIVLDRIRGEELCLDNTLRIMHSQIYL